MSSASLLLKDWSRPLSQRSKLILRVVGSVLVLSILTVLFRKHGPTSAQNFLSDISFGSFGYGESDAFPDSREAYLALMTKDNRLKPVLALEMSHRAVNSTRPRKILVTPNIHPKTLAILRFFDMEPILVEPLPDDVPSLNSLQHSKWRDTPIKFQVFNMTRFERFVVTDADMYLRKNMDELFDKEQFPNDFYAAQDNWICGWGSRTRVSGGLQVVTPNVTYYDDLMEMLFREDLVYHQADQDILTWYWEKQLGERMQHLEYHYMSFINRCECAPGIPWEEEKKVLIHFTHWLHYTGEQFQRHWNDPDRASCYHKYWDEFRAHYMTAEDMVLRHDVELFVHLRDLETLIPSD